MSMVAASILTALTGYLLGSFCFGIITTRIFKNQDIRELGSKNAGMTNVLRAVGVKCGVLTGIGDFAKGVLAILAGRALFAAAGMEPYYGEMLAAMFVLAGHIFPVYFGFRGGKGVMTTAGIMLIVNWKVMVILLAVFIVIFLTTRIISVASITVAALLPVTNYIVCRLSDRPWLASTLFLLGMGALIIFNHRTNIKRLINGTESKLTLKK